MRKKMFIFGFTIFSMFFGSGNLVFPLQIGVATGGYWWLGFIGLFLTGIVLPFLGLFVIKLHHGNYLAFFGEAGKTAQLLLPLFTLSLLGSFGVVPRCITVAHGGLSYVYPDMSLITFSLVFCGLCYLICLKDEWMISILGKWLTPLKLIALTVLISAGVYYAPSLPAPTQTSLDSFWTGFSKGYQTMDLFAAFFFSAVIFQQIQKLVPHEVASQDNNTVLKLALGPSLIGAAILSLVYLSFVYLGAYYQNIAADLSPELILPSIAGYLLGDNATLIIATLIFFSCISAAVALSNVYARYLCTLFKAPKQLYPVILLGTVIVSFLVSLLDFKGISAFLGPILEKTYPSLILLTVLSIMTRKHRLLKKSVFYIVLAFMIIQGYVLT
jgi:LIVCS family branched-chain amino acid:cation transporter